MAEAAARAFRIVADAAPGLVLAGQDPRPGLTGLGETEAGVDALRASLALDPDQTQTWASLAAALLQLERLDDLETACAEALVRDDRNAAAHSAPPPGRPGRFRGRRRGPDPRHRPRGRERAVAGQPGAR